MNQTATDRAAAGLVQPVLPGFPARYCLDPRHGTPCPHPAGGTCPACAEECDPAATLTLEPGEVLCRRCHGIAYASGPHRIACECPEPG